MQDVGRPTRCLYHTQHAASDTYSAYGAAHTALRAASDASDAACRAAFAAAWLNRDRSGGSVPGHTARALPRRRGRYCRGRGSNRQPAAAPRRSQLGCQSATSRAGHIGTTTTDCPDPPFPPGWVGESWTEWEGWAGWEEGSEGWDRHRHGLGRPRERGGARGVGGAVLALGGGGGSGEFLRGCEGEAMGAVRRILVGVVRSTQSVAQILHFWRHH